MVYQIKDKKLYVHRQIEHELIIKCLHRCKFYNEFLWKPLCAKV